MDKINDTIRFNAVVLQWMTSCKYWHASDTQWGEANVRHLSLCDMVSMVTV